MTNTNMLQAMGRIDPKLIVDAAPDIMQKKHTNKVWLKLGAVAACFCLVAVGIFSLLKFDTTHQPTPTLEKISIPELVVGGMSFEGYMYYNASELDNDNPWNENMAITVLPIYRNKAYDSSGMGVPKGLNEEEMRSLLNSAVSALGVEVISTETTTENGEDNGSITTELHAATSNGEIYVYADGGIVYLLPDGGLVLPDGYSFTYSDTTDSEAQETIAYLSSLYSDLLHMETPVSVTWGDYNIDGDYSRRYAVYDSCGNDSEDILNYNLCRVSFFPDDGRLSAITINNALTAAEKIDDYPVISASEARQRLLAGNYQTSVPYAMPGEEYIARVELVYRTGRFEEILLPYYRFYVLLPEIEDNNGLKTYGVYYVPAITDEYIANMPVYDGRFN